MGNENFGENTHSGAAHQPRQALPPANIKNQEAIVPGGANQVGSAQAGAIANGALATGALQVGDFRLDGATPSRKDNVAGAGNVGGTGPRPVAAATVSGSRAAHLHNQPPRVAAQKANAGVAATSAAGQAPVAGPARQVTRQVPSGSVAQGAGAVSVGGEIYPQVASRSPQGRVYRSSHFRPVDLKGVKIQASEDSEATFQQEVVRETPVYLTSFFIHLVLLILLALVVWKAEPPLGVMLVAADAGELATTPLEVDFSLLSLDSQAQSESQELEPTPDSAPLSSTTEMPTTATPTHYAAGDALALREGYSGVSNSGVDMKPSAARALRDQEAYKSKAKFFNVGAEGKRFVFVIDASGSMTEGNRWSMACRELLKSIEGLEEDQEFFVFLYSSGTSCMFDMQPKDIKMHAATPDNYNKLYNWMETRFPLGSTLPRNAMKMAIDLEPDAIFLLSDGEIQDDTYEFLLKYNKPREREDRSPSKIPIHTIALDFSLGGFYLRNIADSNNGKFTQKFSE